ALSSAQVLPEWTPSTSPCNDFSSNGDYPLNFVSHSRGSLHSAIDALPLTLSPLARLLSFCPDEVLTTETALTPQQQQVVDAICSGGAVHSAIAAANVPYKDFLACRRETPLFRRRPRASSR
ncbi:MAG: hypothetical protein ABSH49_28100, partial [Bryobacteraceae bacterium]